MTDEQFASFLKDLSAGLRDIPVVIERLGFIQDQVGRVERKLDSQNGSLKQHGEQLAVLEDWRRCTGEPTAKAAQDTRVEVAKLAVQAAAFGGGAGVMLLLAETIAKALGG